MSINFTSSLIDAMNASYTEGDYVRTLGFFAPGDGGAAVYRVTENTTSAITDKAIPYGNYTLYCLNGQFHIGFDSENTIRPVFEIVPSNSTVFAEQFGVLPGVGVQPSSNTASMNNAVSFSSSKGYKLEFASKETYYFKHYKHPVDNKKDESSIVIKSNLFIEGNGAILRVHNETSDSCNLFNMSSSDCCKNVTVRNLTLVGRTNEVQNLGDQAFHVCIDGFTLHNVAIKNFSFGVHTYGRYTTAGDYTVPEIPNKNWLIDNCTITDTVMGLQLSEIDGITVKDSTIMGYCPTKFPKGTYGPNSNYDGYDYPEAHIFDFMGGLHNIYLSANCLNVRVSNVTMGNSTGDAIHKAFPPNADSDAKKFIRADISKNHFYTDVSINKVNSPLTIGIVSENVMCDNVFATDLRYCIYLSTADNCIVSNSYLSATRDDFPRKGWNRKDNRNICIYTEDASKCWFQNTHLCSSGVHRRASDVFNVASAVPRVFNRIMSANKKHRRNYIGDNFDINNYMLKFTGCDIKSNYSETNWYFEELMRGNETDWLKIAVTEYCDNCNYYYDISQYLFRLKCINSLYGGITIRNSYVNNTYGNRGLFSFECANQSCDCGCYWGGRGKRFPHIHIENVVFDNAGNYDINAPKWEYLAKSIEKPFFKHADAIRVSGSYVKDCYRISRDGSQKINKFIDKLT